MANTKTQKYCQAHVLYCLGTVCLSLVPSAPLKWWLVEH